MKTENPKPKIDKDFFKQLVQIHNDVAVRSKEEKEFDSFVLENKEKINHPLCLHIFEGRIRNNQEYFDDHKEVCQFFYDFMKNNPDRIETDFGFAGTIKLGTFEDFYGKYLETKAKKMID